VHDNNIKFVIAKEGDTYFKIANEFELGLWQIYKYNDLSKKDVLQEGDVIYLQPKRNKAKNEFHRVTEGETMHSISQKYGIKLKKLYKLNNITPGTGEPEPGTMINLRKEKK
jgi:LysM repeat protein